MPAVTVYHAIVKHHIVTDACGQRVERDAARDATGHDARLPPEHGELDVGVGVFHNGLAGEPVLVIQEEALGLCRSVQRFSPAFHLDDALMALAGSSAGRRHADAQRVGVIEDALVGDQFQNFVAVMKRCHVS